MWHLGAHLLKCLLGKITKVLPPLSVLPSLEGSTETTHRLKLPIKSSRNHGESKVSHFRSAYICCDLTWLLCFIFCILAGDWGKIWVTVYLLLLSLCIFLTPVYSFSVLFPSVLPLSSSPPCLSLSNLGTSNNTNLLFTVPLYIIFSLLSSSLSRVLQGFPGLALVWR